MLAPTQEIEAMRARGNLALLRGILSANESAPIEGIDVAVPTAELILQMYEQMSPYAQEVFAAECAAGFWAATWKWLGRRLVREVADAMAHLS